MNSLTTADVGSLLDTFRGDLAPLLAENGQSFDRLKSVFMIAVQQNPDILKCTPESLRREVSKCAADGLVPDSKEAVLLPYWDKDAKAHLANYQPMVYGIIKRMKELGSVFNIVCEIVCANDTFAFNAADPDSLSHSWDVFSSEPRGATRAAYVIFRDDQKRVMHREIMTRAELDDVRKASKAPNSPAWSKFEGEMFQKVVLRRGSKYISVNNDKIRALIERQDDMFDFREARTTDRVNPFTGEVIDGEVVSPSQQRHDRDQDDRQQSCTLPDDQKPADRSESKTAETKADKPAGPPTAPDIDFKAEDKTKAIECAEKILGIALQADLDPPGRRGVLKAMAPEWKDALPEYLHPYLKACIDMTDWAIRQAAADKAWQSEHAMFVHKLKTQLDVEKLNVGKYP